MCCASPPPRDPLYIVGRGCTIPLHQISQEAAAKGRRQGGGGQGWGQQPPRKPNPGWPGPRLGAPPFFLVGFFW
jgi:hypothetical protein